MRRVIFYLFYDPTGQVDDFVLHKLRALREHSEHIFVVSNSPLDRENRDRLQSVADTVWERANQGYDVYAYRDAMAYLGAEELAAYDELLLLNCTFFGPLGSFAPLFASMDADPDLDFWGVSDHGALEPHPFMLADRMEEHIQSHWIGVRRRMFTSTAWAAYWSEMPEIKTYVDSVNLHEGRFTDYFRTAGFTARVAYPASDYPSSHPLIENAEAVLADGCPIVKRRSFFSDPLYLDRRAIDTRALAARVASLGYPVEMLLTNLARTSEPRVLATNLGLLDILPDAAQGAAADLSLRVVAVGHVDEPALLDEMLDRLAVLPGLQETVITAASEPVLAAVRAVLDARGQEAEVRLVDPRGGEMSALLVGCRDLIDRDDIDVIVRLHTQIRAAGGDPNRRELFRRHLHENLLASPGYAANVLHLFEEHASLGMVVPPTMHIGQTSQTHPWHKVKKAAKLESRRLGITVPFDDLTPLWAHGTMFMARPAALRTFTRTPYGADDFADDAQPRGKVRVRVLERLLTYAALSDGFHVREVMHPGIAAMSHLQLEFKYQTLTAHLPEVYTERQLRYLDKLKRQASAGRRTWSARSRKAFRRARTRFGGSSGAPAPSGTGRLSERQVLDSDTET